MLCHYAEATSGLHLLLTRRDVLLCSLISQQYSVCCQSQHTKVFKLVVVEVSNTLLASLKMELRFSERLWWQLVRTSTDGRTSDFCTI